MRALLTVLFIWILAMLCIAAVKHAAAEEPINVNCFYADFDRDLDVDGEDLSVITKSYGFTLESDTVCLCADINRDGTVDDFDLELFSECFGKELS